MDKLRERMDQVENGLKVHLENERKVIALQLLKDDPQLDALIADTRSHAIIEGKRGEIERKYMLEKMPAAIRGLESTGGAPDMMLPTTGPDEHEAAAQGRFAQGVADCLKNGRLDPIKLVEAVKNPVHASNG